MRITIVGSAGSGKTTLARAISETFGIPHLHIDRLWFQAGGHALRKGDETKKEQVRAYIRENVERFIKQDSWVADGWYRRVQPLIAQRADHIVFLDIPLWRRLSNHLTRVITGERHPELSRRQDLMFVFEIIKRRFTKEPKLRAFVRENAGKVTTLRSYTEVDQYLDTL